MATALDRRLAATIERADMRHYPERFVEWAFPWQEPGTVLEHEKGPEEWQRDILVTLGQEIRTRNFNGHDPVAPIRIAVTSGHDIGKSALTAWLVLYCLVTRPYCKGSVTAGSVTQLETKTWAEVAKWKKLCLVGHWFEYHNTKGHMRCGMAGHKDNYFIGAYTCRKENTESFAGQHAPNSTSLFIFDEASQIIDGIYEVAEGGLTDGEPWFVQFGNPTRRTGKFFEAFHGQAHRWITRQIDSRTVPRPNKELHQQWIDDYGIDSDFVRVRTLGKFPRASSMQIIASDLVAEAQDRELTREEYAYAPVIIGVDVARYGDDQSVIAVRQGRKLHPLVKLRPSGTTKGWLMQLAARVAEEVERWNANAVIVDVVGIGAGVYDRLKDLLQGGTVRPLPVNGGTPSRDRGQRDMNAYMWCAMRDWFRDDAPDVPADAELERDLTNREYGFLSDGRLALEKKEDLKKRDLPSPDCGDALAYTWAYPVRFRTPAERMQEAADAARDQLLPKHRATGHRRRAKARHEYEVV